MFSDKGGRITSGEGGLGEVNGVSVEVIRVAADTPPPDGQRKGDGALSR